MPKAICLRCGQAKRAPWQVCLDCKFDPNGDAESLIKSVYLSAGRFDDNDAIKKYETVLEQFSQKIKNGKEISFDPSDLDRLRLQRVEVRVQTRSEPEGDGSGEAYGG